MQYSNSKLYHREGSWGVISVFQAMGMTCSLSEAPDHSELKKKRLITNLHQKKNYSRNCKEGKQRLLPLGVMTGALRSGSSPGLMLWDSKQSERPKTELRGVRGHPKSSVAA